MKPSKPLQKIYLTLFFLLVFLAAQSALVFSAFALEKQLIPGGELFGVKLDLDGVLVKDYAPFESENRQVSPAQTAGLLPGDLIVSADGTPMHDLSDFIAVMDRKQASTFTLDVVRKEEIISLSLTPKKSAEDGKYRAGFWANEGMAGVGTVTFYDPTDDGFGGLGHGVFPAENESLVPIEKGVVYPAVVKSVVRGNSGAPGELRAIFGEKTLGAVTQNTERGVFGTLPKQARAPIPVATRQEVRVGPARILATVDGTGPCFYEVEITQIRADSTPTKNFLITVTDPALLEKTGGIVQGMSGSPIIQNGHLVGAVTHVLVNDPTTGYGIFIENMLDAA